MFMTVRLNGMYSWQNGDVTKNQRKCILVLWDKSVHLNTPAVPR